eukprot:TRINITY_DN6847_c0_g1_i3.p1 TRINITY_DN6847_c0_g1~~TRINITY_DN6847_c0_g1_i3.p1  ORF type:complete len:159 (-),score=5.95 TRINITY_DN6847_c0_g1_i3:36-512(-)
MNSYGFSASKASNRPDLDTSTLRRSLFFILSITSSERLGLNYQRNILRVNSSFTDGNFGRNSGKAIWPPPACIKISGASSDPSRLSSHRCVLNNISTNNFDPQLLLMSIGFENDYDLLAQLPTIAFTTTLSLKNQLSPMYSALIPCLLYTSPSPRDQA